MLCWTVRLECSCLNGRVPLSGVVCLPYCMCPLFWDWRTVEIFRLLYDDTTKQILLFCVVELQCVSRSYLRRAVWAQLLKPNSHYLLNVGRWCYSSRKKDARTCAMVWVMRFRSYDAFAPTSYPCPSTSPTSTMRMILFADCNDGDASGSNLHRCPAPKR